MAANFINTSGNVIANSGNFTTLIVNGTSISNFNSSVSGLLPTIANSGDNRILTSTGSSVGINAEANLTFDGSTLGIIGNVGAGTSSPTQRLQVHGSSGDDVYLRISNTDTTTASGLLIGLMATEDAVIRVEPNKALTFGTNNTERMRITSGGNLEIKSNAGNISTLFTYNENGGELVHYDDAQVAATLLDQCSNQTRLLELINGSDLLLGLGGSNTTGSVRFMRAGFSEIMRINSSGNIGIGSSTNNDNIRTRLQVCGPDADDDPSLGSGTGALLVTNSDSAYGMQFGVSSDGVGWIQQGRVDGTATAYNLLLNPVGGNVGIGTSSPQQKFVVSNSGAEGMEIIPALNANESRIQTYNRSTSAWNKFSINCGTFELFTNGGTTTIFGNTSGNVGIGTSLPTPKLHVYGAGSATNAPSTTSSLGATIGVQDSGGASSNGGMVMFGAIQGFFAAIKGLITDGTPNTLGDLIFTTRNATGDSALTERVRITSGGNFGIGSGATTPPELLSVMKDNNAGRTSILIDNLDQRLKMSCYYESGVGQYSEIQSTNNAETGHQVLILNRQGGNVAIGTTNPSAKLLVSGSGEVINGSANGGSGTTNYGVLGQATGAATNNTGFYANASNATNNYGVRIVAPAAGANNWAIYSDATAKSYFAGNTGIGVQPTYRFEVRGSGATSSTVCFYISNSSATALLYIRDDGAINTGAAAVSPYNNVTGTAANMVVGSDGFLYRSTSSLRYKTQINDATHGLNEVLKLRSVTFKSQNDGNKIFGGLIAEEVDSAGLTEFVQYDSENRPDAIHYSNMVALLIKAIQEQQTQINQLKNRLSVLEGE